MDCPFVHSCSRANKTTVSQRCKEINFIPITLLMSRQTLNSCRGTRRPASVLLLGDAFAKQRQAQLLDSMRGTGGKGPSAHGVRIVTFK